MQDVVRIEVLKLLDSGIIYPFFFRQPLGESHTSSAKEWWNDRSGA